MARPVGDSDDEFPDLAEIISRKVVARKPASSGSSRPGKTLETDNGFLDESRIGNRTTQGRIERSGSKSKRREDSETVKPRPKKRILNQTSDNPLLRPFASSASGKDGSDGLKRSSPKIQARKQKLVSKSIPNAESEDVSKLGPGGESLKENEDLGKQEKPRKRAVGKEKAKLPTKKVVGLNSDEGEYGDDSGLSDFIVDDSTFLDEESIVEAPPPRSVRRLVQGRRRPAELEDSDSDDLGRRMGKLKFEDDVFQDSQKTSVDLEDFAGGYGDMEPLVRTKRSGEGAPSKHPKAAKTAANADLMTSDIDDPFTLS